ncbi:MAG: glycosyltransferase family 2 protein [Candidatus Omnitrophica bacterium]|nr:glycosyltransferase family 2 protein [Candidatus Omnitrophota bacterium]
MRAQVSAILHVYNEAHQIRECLEGIKWADEIIIMDCFSQDDTVAIASQFTQKIHQRRYINAAEAKNWLLTQATREWILAIDADERCTQELAQEIQQRFSFEDGTAGYSILLQTFCLGRKMQGWPKGERQVRLFKKTLARWEDKEVHSKLVVHGSRKELVHPLLHYPYPTINALWVKFDRYTTFEARARQKGKKRLGLFGFLKILIGSFTIFFRMVFLRGCFRDGRAGLLLAFFSACYPLVSVCKSWGRRE